MPKIKSLSACNFRGIVEEAIELGGCSIVILGENGTGKSSFIDAIEFYFNGSVKHLEGAQGISTNRHAPHIHASREQTAVTIQFEKQDSPLCRTFEGISSVPKELGEFHRRGANATFILRRKNLLDFILAQPAERYEQLAAIIGVEELDGVERSLMQTRDELQDEVERITLQVQGEVAKLSELIGEIDPSSDKVLASLNRKLQEIGQEPLSTLAEAEKRKLSIVTQSRSQEDLQRAILVQNALSHAASLQEKTNIIKEHHTYWTSVDELQKDATLVRELLFREVLTTSSRLLGKYADIDTCPVCLQPINRQELLVALDERVRRAQSISAKSEEIKGLGSNLSNAIDAWSEENNGLNKTIAELGVSWDCSRVTAYQQWLQSLNKNIKAEPVDLKLIPFEQAVKSPEGIGARQCLKELINQLQAEKSRLEPTEQDRIAVQVIDLITRVMDARQTLLNLQPKLEAKKATHRELAGVYDTFVSTKRSEIQRIYIELQDDIRRFLDVLHPNEGYQEVRLEVNEGRRASTEIKMDFHDRRGEDPRAFNSEGHLDSLGLCIFLAFVKRFNTDFPIIALDDVISSIDSAHRQRVCDLLFNEFPDAQWLITTHDYIWFEELHAYQRAHGQEAQFKNLQILDWSIDDGPRLGNYKSRWEQIEEKLANGDRDGAAAAIRKEIEAFLFEVAIELQVRIPIKRDGKYTIGDLHDPVVSYFQKQVPDVCQAKSEVFKNLQTNVIFGNLLTHNNPRAGNASLEEIRGFAEAVKNFESVFICPHCNRIVAYYREAKVIKCNCRQKGLLWTTKT
jgi:recombinational DNA repair ATPase RecF/uncharacterized protein YukE